MIKLLKDMKITEHFYLSEFLCNDGSEELLLDYTLVKKLQALRYYTGKSIKINSGYRTKSWNTKVGGSPKSQHMLGTAADIVIEGLQPKEVAKLAEKVGFDGIGVYDTFTHVDVRGYRARW